MSQCIKLFFADVQKYFKENAKIIIKIRKKTKEVFGIKGWLTK